MREAAIPALSILLTGATGYVGGLLSLLESRGHRVRWRARRPRQLRPRPDYLKIGLGVVLAFVGVKMLATSVAASLLRPETTGSFEGPGGPASLGA